MKYRFIQRHTEEHSVASLCAVLAVSRSGYYAWLRRRPSRRQQANEHLRGLIRLVHERSRQSYGYRRVHAALRLEGEDCGKNRVARLMSKEGLFGRRHRRFRHTTQ